MPDHGPLQVSTAPALAPACGPLVSRLCWVHTGALLMAGGLLAPEAVSGCQGHCGPVAPGPHGLFPSQRHSSHVGSGKETVAEARPTPCSLSLLVRSLGCSRGSLVFVGCERSRMVWASPAPGLPWPLGKCSEDGLPAGLAWLPGHARCCCLQGSGLGLLWSTPPCPQGWILRPSDS